MKASDLMEQSTPPIAIGGVGGSGTRLIAQCLKELGFFMGRDLNEANDNLWFTLLFKRIEVLSSSEEQFDELTTIMHKGMTGSEAFTPEQIDLINQLASTDREQHPAAWLKQRMHSLLSEKHPVAQNTRWGWKEPNTHIVVDRLKKRLKSMKYIHVVRNGLDMAHSSNQNQLKLWGRNFIGEDCNISPYYSLKYWCIVHRRVLEIGATMGIDFLFLNYDDFCLNPQNGIAKLYEFLGLDAVKTPHPDLLGLVRPPSSIGRFKQHGTHIFDKADVAYVKALGFDTGI
ncbi:MAG: sulfotransferase [Candidatus Contendobacter sp.]